MGLLALNGGAVTGCSLMALDKCSSDAQCEQAFGLGATCDTSQGLCLVAEVRDAAPPDAGADDRLVLANYCQNSDNVPLVDIAGNSANYVVDTTDLDDRARDLLCLDGVGQGGDLIGNDGFFAVDMAAGERWHFHVSLFAGFESADPALYVLNSCDLRSCELGDGSDVCGASNDEHMSFIAPSAGRYYVGVDSRQSGGAAFTVNVIRPVCGNGTVEHSESCDDDNTDDGDGCDSGCRKELASGDSEEEPNDDTIAHNLLRIGNDGTTSISATTGGRCDPDVFALDVEEAESLRIEVLDAEGEPCANAIPGMSMVLYAPDGIAVLGRGQVREGNACPIINPVVFPGPVDENGDDFASELAAGRYYLGISADDNAPLSRYNLEVRRLPPPESPSAARYE